MVKGKELKRITENGYCVFAVAVFALFSLRKLYKYQYQTNR